MDLPALNGWIAGGGGSVVAGAIALLWRRVRRAGTQSPSLAKRLARWASATGRVPLVEDALDYTTEYNHQLIEQRNLWLAERAWYQAELERLSTELLRLRAHPPSPLSPAAESLPGSGGGSTGSAGERRRRKPTGG